MESFDLWPQLAALGQVIAIDLVLAGDNAIVVGMAAATVPLEQRRKVIFWGIGAAIALRIFFALITTQLLAIIGLTLAGGVLLLWVCWKMYRELRSHGRDEVAPDEAMDAKAAGAVGGVTIGAAIWQIVVADVSMSLDNVLAGAGAAQDTPPILVLSEDLFRLGVSRYVLTLARRVRLVDRDENAACRENREARVRPLGPGV